MLILNMGRGCTHMRHGKECRGESILAIFTCLYSNTTIPLGYQIYVHAIEDEVGGRMYGQARIFEDEAGGVEGGEGFVAGEGVWYCQDKRYVFLF